MCSKLDTESHMWGQTSTHSLCRAHLCIYFMLVSSQCIALQGMVNKLKGKQVSPQLANDFRVCLKLDENDVPADQTDLGIISNKWILKNTASCSPEALVEALVLTPGLGKFASGIGCKFYLLLLTW